MMIDERVRSAAGPAPQLPRRSARWRSSKNGQARKLVRSTSIALEDRLLFRGEGAIGAGEILRRHAQGLRHRFRLDRLPPRDIAHSIASMRFVMVLA